MKYANHGKASSAERNSGQNQNWVKGIEEDFVLKKTIELLQQRWQQNIIDPTPTEELQLLHLWLLKTKLKGQKMVYMITKPGRLVHGNT